MKYLLLGSKGYVGSAFAQRLKNEQLACPSRQDLDLSNPAQIKSYLEKSKPDFVINCAGYTGKPNVDACEYHKSECLFGNSVLPGYINEACEALGIPWGHVSSGCIYSGNTSDGKGFTETDEPNFSFRKGNCSFYSGCKALGEEVLKTATSAYVWRLRIPFNEVDNARNYLSKLMRYDKLLDAENSISQLDHFVETALATWTQSHPFGVYNITNPGAITSREVVDMIRESGLTDRTFSFFESEDAFNKIVKAPRSNCVLNTDKIERLGIAPPPVKEAIKEALYQWKKES